MISPRWCAHRLGDLGALKALSLSQMKKPDQVEQDNKAMLFKMA